MPEQRIACDNRQSIIKAAHKLAACIPNARLITTDGIRIECAYGWMLIRPAQTEPVLSIRCEGATLQGLEEMKKLLSKLLNQQHLQTLV